MAEAGADALAASSRSRGRFAVGGPSLGVPGVLAPGDPTGVIPIGPPYPNPPWPPVGTVATTCIALEGCIANNGSFWVDTNSCATIDKPYACRLFVGVAY